MNLLFKNEFAEMYELSEEYPQTLLVSWIGFWEVDDKLKEILDKSLALIKEKNSKILISDCQKLDTLSEEVSNFLESYWYPKAEEYGLKLEIYIGAEDFVSQLSLEMLFESVDDKEKIATVQCENREEARKFAKHYSSKKGEQFKANIMNKKRL